MSAALASASIRGTLGALVTLAVASAPTPACADAASAALKPIPAEAFYRHAEIESAALSPSGRWLALSTGLGGERFGLVTVDLVTGGPPQNTARFGNGDVGAFRWVNDDRLVFSVGDREATGGMQRVGGRLLGARVDGSDMHALIQAPTRNRGYFLLKVPDGLGDHVVVGEAKPDDRNGLAAVYPLQVNVITTSVKLLAAEAPRDVTGWLFDPKGEPLIGTATRKGRFIVYGRASDKQAWVELSDSDALAPAFVPQFVDSLGRLFVTTAEGPAGTAVLKLFDFAAHKPAADPFVRTPGFDFRGHLLTDPMTGRTLGLRIWTDAATTVWFDESMKAVQQSVDAKLAGRINFISCARCAQADKVILIYSFSDQDPGHYWLYRPEGERWQDIGPKRTGIDPRRMARLDLHRIRARDGLDMPVWVTTPSEPAAAAARPAVVLVHGGPWVRGVRWGWHADAQFLASRGYVVIEPEFRGSAGYGHDHLKAGFKQWGRAMQDDIADALQWAVAKGFADSKRVCIAGASYGGYATLMGLARHPELYRCGVAWAAVTDPRLMFGLDWVSDISDDAKRFGYPALIGDPVKDADALKATVPVELAARIKAPLLLAFGAKDRRVPLEHGDRMRAALRAAGNDPEWVLYPDEGHGWYLVADRVDFAERMERFLARHLKP